jgi:hypothetical protein
MTAAIEKRMKHLGEGLYGLAELSRYIAYDSTSRADPNRTSRWL